MKSVKDRFIKMNKVKFYDVTLRKNYLTIVGIASSFVTLVSFFVTADKITQIDMKCLASIAIVLLILIYFYMWIKANQLQEAHLRVNQTKVNIRVGNIFATRNEEINVIAVNDFYDTIADNRIISKSSLHGQYILKNANCIEEIDRVIASDPNLNNKVNIEEENVNRQVGKQKRYKLGSVVEIDSFVLTAFAKFDFQNKAFLSAREYVEFWMKFWENIDGIYAGRTINIPLIGVGITRFRDGKPTKQELLEIMLWTLKISGFHCTYANKSINIEIFEPDAEEIDFYHIQHGNKFK